MQFKSSVSTLALLAAGMAGASLAGVAAAQAQAVNTTPSNVNVLNLLSPFLALPGTAVGQATASQNLSQAIATNNNATAAQQALSVSDKNLFGGRTNTITLANGTTATYGIAANLAGGLPAQAQVTPSAGATTTTPTTPIQAVGGLGSVLGPIYQRGVQPIGTGAATTAILANTATLLNTAYGSFTSIDLGVAKNYFANGAATNPSTTPANYVAVPAVAPAGYTLPTYTLPSGEVLPNTSNSVYDIAGGVKNTQAGQDVYGDSRPVQIAPTPPNGINQFDSTSIAGLSTNPSFPSGHTNYAFTDSTLIGMLVPQSFQSMLLRASEYGNSRIVLGVHYPLDIIASRAFSTYDLVQAFTNPAYQNGTNTSSSFNLLNQFTAAQGEIQRNLATLDPSGQCGGSVANCATSAANTANDPYVPSAANAAAYVARLTYGLPTIAGAPKELTDTKGLSAAVILSPLYGGDTAAAKAIAPSGGIDGQLATTTINQIIANTEGDPLAAFYGSQLSYWTRINLYAAAGYFGGVTGTLSLQSSDLVTQNVTIASGGTLDANGTVTGTVAVAQGGTLTGSGTVGTVAASAGSIVAPGSLAAQAALLGGQGNVSGTGLSVSGSVAFDPASTFAVTASPTQVTSLAATGTAALNGAAVTVALPTAAGSFPGQSRNAIVTAAGGVSGTFSGVTTNLLFATPTLSYDANDAYLTLGGPNFRVAAATRNQYAVASALSNGALANANASVVVGLETLQTGQNAAGAAALGSLSGSGLTATQNLAHRSTQAFVSSISDQLTFFAASPGNVNSVTFTDEFAARAQGFAPVRELADLPASRVAPVVPAERPRSFRVWATGFGGAENISGNAGIGYGAENNTIVGGSAGLDYQFMPGALVGIAAGGTSGNFNVPNFATSGSTTGGHVAGYGLANYGPYYGASSVTGSFFSNQTTRTVAAAGVGETDNGSFSSREIRLRIEAGRRFAGSVIPGLGGLLGPAGSITPFVALEVASLHSSTFSEFNRSGPTVLGLTVASQDTADVPAFVGARFERVTPLGNGMVFTPALQVAYVHDFSPQRNELGSFAGLPQAVFLVDGARPAYNSAQVKAGAELAITPRMALFANFDGEFSNVAQFYGGKGGFRFAF